MIPICHVQLLPLLSGVQRVMLDIFDHVDRDRYELHVVCQRPGPLTEVLNRRRVRCHYVPEMVRPVRPWDDLRAMKRMQRLFRAHKFELVHTHSSKPGVLGRLAARRAGVPCVVHHVQGFAFHEFTPRPKAWFYRRIERMAARRCDRLIFANHEDREMAIRSGIAPAEQCLTIYNGADLHAVNPGERRRQRRAFRTRCGLSQNEVAVVVMGRLAPQKQPLILPQIAAHLNKRRPSQPWRILVAGDGPLEEALSAEVARRELGDCVRLLGWQADAAGAYAAADIVLHASLWEGLPLTLIEAQAAGLPVVASDVKGNREVVTRQDGRLCPPHDAEAFASELHRLIDHGDVRIRMGAAARKRAAQHFNKTINMGKIAALYDELLEGAAGSSITAKAA